MCRYVPFYFLLILYRCFQYDIYRQLCPVNESFLSRQSFGIWYLILGHYFDGACLLTAIDESTGNVMSIIEWKPIANKKKIQPGSNSLKGDPEISKQVKY